MKGFICFFLVVLTFASHPVANAQDRLKGLVLEYKSNEALQQVLVKNLTKGDSVITNKNGAFDISANKDDVLSFSYPGYRTDSLVVTDFAVKRVYLTSINDPRILKEVNITALTNSKLAEEKERMRKQAQFANTVSGGGIGLSPSKIFGREAKEARRQYKMLEEESNNRIIDAKFTEILVTSLTPLQGQDLSLFMAKYRPKVAFVKEADDERMRLYIMDSYNEFKKLSQAAKEKIKINK